MSKGTIIYVGGFELPDKNAAAHRVVSNAKIFRDLGYKVVFIGVDRLLDFNTDILTTYKTAKDFDSWSVGYPNTLLNWVNHLSNIKHIKTIIEKYDDIKAVIAYNYPAYALNNLRRLGAKSDIKIIADCTEWRSARAENIMTGLIRGLDSFFRMRVVQKKLDGLIVISNFLENYYKESRNVVKIPPLVDIYEDKWNCKNYYDNKVSNDACKVSFVYSGSPGKDKDKINYIIDAFYELREFRNYQMDIIGVTKSQFLQDYPGYKDRIKCLDNRINFIGRLTHKESLRMLMKADYSIFIRDRSRLTMAGFPTKFVESISCSTPVITNDSSDISDYFEDDSGGHLINNFSTEKLVEVLKKIISNCTKVENSQSKIDSQIFHYGRYQDVLGDMMSRILE